MVAHAARLRGDWVSIFLIQDGVVLYYGMLLVVMAQPSSVGVKADKRVKIEHRATLRVALPRVSGRVRKEKMNVADENVI
jgi:hypothetical protein